jgi:hypothetical protein
MILPNPAGRKTANFEENEHEEASFVCVSSRDNSADGFAGMGPGEQ